MTLPEESNIIFHVLTDILRSHIAENADLPMMLLGSRRSGRLAICSPSVHLRICGCGRRRIPRIFTTARLLVLVNPLILPDPQTRVSPIRARENVLLDGQNTG